MSGMLWRMVSGGDDERQAQLQRDRLASQPVLDDLRAIGIDVDSVWDLDKVADSRPRAIPVLLKHLTLDYPDRVLEGIGQGLDDKSARPWWEDLRALLVETKHPVVRDRVACALSTCASQQHYDDLLTFINDEDLGESRIYFLRATNRIGNRIAPGQGRSAIEAAALNPVLTKEAKAILKGQSRNK